MNRRCSTAPSATTSSCRATRKCRAQGHSRYLARIVHRSRRARANDPGRRCCRYVGQPRRDGENGACHPPTKQACYRGNAKAIVRMGSRKSHHDRPSSRWRDVEHSPDKTEDASRPRFVTAAHYLRRWVFLARRGRQAGRWKPVIVMRRVVLQLRRRVGSRWGRLRWRGLGRVVGHLALLLPLQRSADTRDAG